MMDLIEMVIYSDYICPWCYVGQGVVEKLRKEYPMAITWRPYFLRPDIPPEGMDIPEELNDHMAEIGERLKQMADAAGLEIVFPKHLPNTRFAHEATEYADQKGKGFEFHREVFARFYGKGEDIGQWQVLQSAAKAVGLDADEMKRQVEEGKYTQAVQDHIAEAVKWGIESVPTYIINNRYAIVGAQPYDRFLQVIRKIDLPHNQESIQ
ncbi:MAG TPA: DsbA family oxidoreductase [Flexilinea sp.]|jgi:predicted DsbA family dithiol-disulfide isomerase|nr:DsbA family oxidoreductase [Flexilinea sp.]HPR71162.1 DsbA family oxidoreductase [Flexilinea sp.]